ncbi:VOC family protein [Bacillus sp. C11]|nr:VOC family protein [Neobacillus terrae]
MKIYQLNIKSFRLKEMKGFYTDVLKMPLVSESKNHFAVMAGTTKLVFEKDESITFYHLCFRTNDEFFEDMFEKLSSKKLLLPDEEGSYSMFWKGRQAYFTDPDGNILELLERPYTWSEEGVVKGWHDVGEIGLPVENIAQFQSELEDYKLNIFKRESDTFSFFGDENGVFVMVKEGRHWYPTENEAAVHPISVIVSGEIPGHIRHNHYPYEIKIRKEWEGTIPAVQVRIARPTNQIDRLYEFYHDGLGLKKIGEFHAHEGYDGIMLGLPDNSAHLEFTQTEQPSELAKPTKENLLVFYLPNVFERDRIAEKLRLMGYPETEPENPYWGRGGMTIEDPDGWRIVLMNTPGIG